MCNCFLCYYKFYFPPVPCILSKAILACIAWTKSLCIILSHKVQKVLLLFCCVFLLELVFIIRQGFLCGYFFCYVLEIKIYCISGFPLIILVLMLAKVNIVLNMRKKIGDHIGDLRSHRIMAKYSWNGPKELIQLIIMLQGETDCFHSISDQCLVSLSFKTSNNGSCTALSSLRSIVLH